MFNYPERSDHWESFIVNKTANLAKQEKIWKCMIEFAWILGVHLWERHQYIQDAHYSGAILPKRVLNV